MEVLVRIVVASLYICDMTMSPNTFFSRRCALCNEILVSNILLHSLVGVSYYAHNRITIQSTQQQQCLLLEGSHIDMQCASSTIIEESIILLNAGTIPMVSTTVLTLIL